MATVAKSDLAQRVAEATYCPQHLALEGVDALFTALRQRLLAGDRIEVRGFGTLSVKQVAPRPTARNPRTGETVQVPARRKVHFKPGKELREGLHRPRGTG